MEIEIINMSVVKIKHRPEIGYFRVDRYTSLGNPFELERGEDRDKVCEKYDEYFHKILLKDDSAKRYLHRILTYLRHHKEVHLMCWCYPRRCHAETIKKWLLDNVDAKERYINNHGRIQSKDSK